MNSTKQGLLESLRECNNLLTEAAEGYQTGYMTREGVNSRVSIIQTRIQIIQATVSVLGMTDD